MKKFTLIFAFALAVFTACEKNEEEVVVTYDPAKDGLVGEWYSSKTNVAPLLAYLKIDSIYAKFNADKTYLVESFNQGSKTTMTGVYTQTKSATGNIWEITLNQNTPTTLTSKGIFEVTSTVTPMTMKYEVAQTDPVITGVTAPTATGGFGSTSSGAYGQNNVQKYIRITK